MHATSDKPNLQHRATPRGPRDSHRNRIGAVNWVATDQFLATAARDNGVPMVLRLNFQHHALAKLVQVDTPFNL